MTMLVKKAFISSEFIPSVSLCPLPWAFLFSRVLQKKDFPIKQERVSLAKLFRRPWSHMRHISIRARVHPAEHFYVMGNLFSYNIKTA